MFCIVIHENTPKCTTEKAYSSKTQAKSPFILHIRAEHQRRRRPGPAKSPHAEGGGQARSLGCSRTLGAVALPPALLGPTFLWWCIQCTGRRLHAVFPKIPEQTDHPQAIKGGPSSHLRGSYTFWRRRRRATHIPLASS